MEQFTGPAAGRTLLDVGAYTGVFVEIAAQHGWDAWFGQGPTSAISRGRRILEVQVRSAPTRRARPRRSPRDLLRTDFPEPLAASAVATAKESEAAIRRSDLTRGVSIRHRTFGSED